MSEAKRRLDYFRREGNQLQESLAEADINGMLERLAQLFRNKRDDCNAE